MLGTCLVNQLMLRQQPKVYTCAVVSARVRACEHRFEKDGGRWRQVYEGARRGGEDGGGGGGGEGEAERAKGCELMQCVCCTCCNGKCGYSATPDAHVRKPP